MEAFQLLVLVVSIVAMLLACTSHFRVNRVLEQLDHDQLRMYHPTDPDLDEQSPPPVSSPRRPRAA